MESLLFNFLVHGYTFYSIISPYKNSRRNLDKKIIWVRIWIRTFSKAGSGSGQNSSQHGFQQVSEKVKYFGEVLSLGKMLNFYDFLID
jgi:hypothetical protein